jgi:hypothetical protein
MPRPEGLIRSVFGEELLLMCTRGQIHGKDLIYNYPFLRELTPSVKAASILT